MRRQQGAAAAAAGIGASRLSGLARTALVTNVLGIGTIGDAFAAAMRIPNFLQNLLGEGALSGAFVPAYSSLTERDETGSGSTRRRHRHVPGRGHRDGGAHQHLRGAAPGAAHCLGFRG